MAAMIYLLRHGDAEPEGHEGDAARRLTTKGEAQAAAAGRAIAALGLTIDSCVTSPRIRARDTAELACHALGIAPEIVDSIGFGDYDTMDLAAGRGDMLLVGHEPVLSMEVARLTGARIKMKKGGLAILEPNVLRALLRPAELAAIAGT
jgi:phosphohistidine phosphatase